MGKFVHEDFFIEVICSWGFYSWRLDHCEDFSILGDLFMEVFNLF